MSAARDQLRNENLRLTREINDVQRELANSGIVSQLAKTMNTVLSKCPGRAGSSGFSKKTDRGGREHVNDGMGGLPISNFHDTREDL